MKVVASLEGKVALDETVLSPHEGVEVTEDLLGGLDEGVDLAVDQVVESVEEEEGKEDDDPLIVLLVVDYFDLEEGTELALFRPDMTAAVNAEHLLLVSVHLLNQVGLHHLLPQKGVVLLHPFEDLTGDEGGEVKSLLVLSKTEPVVEHDPESEERGDQEEEHH